MSRHYRHHHPENEEGRGHGRGHHKHDEGRGGHHGGGHGGRARRGDAKYVILSVLEGGGKHGYEVIKTLEERSFGRYAPSAGTVYPTLQMLEDLGWAQARQEGERRVFALTEAGRAELASHQEELSQFWGRFGQTEGSTERQAELQYLKEELEELEKAVWSGVKGLADAEDTEILRRIRATVEACKNSVRSLLTTPSQAVGDKQAQA